MADERARAIDLAFAQIEKQFGKGSIMRLGSKEAIVPISVISTGAISFDSALGVGGFPRGRVIEVFGPESSGKTTITLQVIAEAQKADQRKRELEPLPLTERQQLERQMADVKAKIAALSQAKTRMPLEIELDGSHDGEFGETGDQSQEQEPHAFRLLKRQSVDRRCVSKVEREQTVGCGVVVRQQPNIGREASQFRVT